uniref:Small ribosomal subunit protein mS25 n=1 Tax=Syphacia muris TaxID=451379 RepID=A0A0N5AU27_9BILA
MPFMRGSMPLRRTLYYLKQGKIFFRSNVKVFAIGFHRVPEHGQEGAREFVYWHWAQLQYNNPKVQLVKFMDRTIVPFAMAFLEDGRQILFDLENKSREEVVNILSETLGKTDLVKIRERLEEVQEKSPAAFGSDCERHCICEVQGQHPCTSLCQAPEYLRGNLRWNHKNLVS